MARRLLAGGVPGPGVVVERFIEVIYTFTAKKGKKTAGFAHVFAYKSLKTPFFALKFLTRYTHETFLRNTLILTFFVT